MADSLIRTSGLPGAHSAAQWALRFGQYTAASKDLAQPFDLGILGFEGAFWPSNGPGGQIAEQLSDWLGDPEGTTAKLDAHTARIDESLNKFITLINARNAEQFTDEE